MTDERIDALFAGPPEDFVVARDALAKALKAEGDAAASTAVKKLRRPTVAAAAVNRLVRDAPEEIDALVAIGDRLRTAHEKLLEGGGNSAIREATAERRRIVAALAGRAVAALGPGGEAQREAITHTLDAAVADADAAAEVRAGRLTRELEAPSGFGGGLVFPEPAATPTSRDDRRAARRARRAEPATDDPGPTADTARETASPPAERAAAAKKAATAARKEAEARRRRIQSEAEAAAAAARAAAIEASAARQEVARRRDDLADAERRLRHAEDRARDAQRLSAAAQAAMRRDT